MMKNFRIDKLYVDDTLVNFQSNMPITEIMRLFEVTAFRHSNDIGLDHASMLKNSNVFWVVTKIKVKVLDNIHAGEKLSIKTWIPAPSLIRADRFGQIKCQNKIKAKVLSEWCCLDYDTHKIRKMSTIKYPDIELIDTHECNLKFDNAKAEMTAKNYVYTKTIMSSDIDLNMHTNNLKYNTIAMDAFSVDELKNFDIKEYEIHFICESHEGDKLDVYKQKKGNTYFIEGRNGDTPVFRVILKIRPLTR